MDIISSFTIIDINEFKKVIKNSVIKDALFIMTITKHKLVIVGIKEDASVIIRSSISRDMLIKFVPSTEKTFSFSIKRFCKSFLKFSDSKLIQVKPEPLRNCRKSTDFFGRCDRDPHYTPSRAISTEYRKLDRLPSSESLQAP